MGFFSDVFGSNNAISRAENNYEKRQKINEYNAKAKEYIVRGQDAYNNVYCDFVMEAGKVKLEIESFVNYKRRILNDINASLSKLGLQKYDIDVNIINRLKNLDCNSAGSLQYSEFDGMIDRLTLPSVSDFVSDTSSIDVYTAKANMQRAKAYKERMYSERERLRNAKYAVREIPRFMNDEKTKINVLMEKFRKTEQSIKQSQSKEKAEALCNIADIIAQTLTTQFIDNNYEITSQYNEIDKQIDYVNNSLESARWLIEG